MSKTRAIFQVTSKVRCRIYGALITSYVFNSVVIIDEPALPLFRSTKLQTYEW
jgi:hypothetical protein